MKPVYYYSTNDKSKKVTFRQAFLEGQSYPDYGLFTIGRDDVPKLNLEQIKAMKSKSYAEIAFEVLSPYLVPEIPENDLEKILMDAYLERFTPGIQYLKDNLYLMWLAKGPTYSFKDYAARFFGRVLNYFLERENIRKVVITATSGDTGGAVADALCGLERADNVVFFPKDFISERQRRQMTTLGKNIYAIAVNGDFDVCQALAKRLLADKDFAGEICNDESAFTSANSISIGRLLPQAVYPFYAYSRILSDVILNEVKDIAGVKRPAQNSRVTEFIPPLAGFPPARNATQSVAGGRDSSSSPLAGTPQNDELLSIIASIPSGNFGDMMGTVIAKEMGLPVSKIICGVNENAEFPEFLETGRYEIKPTRQSPSSAMMVSHPSNLARLFDFYGGRIYDERNAEGKVSKRGVIAKMPDVDEMKKDIFSVSVANEEHYQTIKEVYEKYRIILDPHGAVGWKALDKFLKSGGDDKLSVIYETADPAKFPEDVKKAIGISPEVPEGIKKQAHLEERIYYVNSEPDVIGNSQTLSESQYNEAKNILRNIFKK